eukprot:m.85095 g.85095  ORF g.85095 m.85095 type:complete len:404 (+) comp21245_c1_seq1:104-1315(+)
MAEDELDMPEGYQLQHINRSTWVTPQYYTNFAPIGAGAFGSVCSAENIVNGERVAIKKLQNPFQTKIHAQRAFREIRLLRFMQHENVIGMHDLFCAPCPGQEEPDIYLVTDLMGSDLHTIIQSQIISDEHVRFLVYQMLRALVYVHSAGILHRDLKPSNIAINQDCDLKILDFGLARVANHDGGMTGYVATRWYRAPEIMLRWGNYKDTVDMWSVGCIMAELLTGRALFQGQDHVQQLNKICQLLGRPSQDYIESIESPSARQYVQSLNDGGGQDFREVFDGVNEEAIDLLEKLLMFDTEQRLTAWQAIRHPYFAKLHDPDDEPIAHDQFDDSFEQMDLDVNGWKELILNEITEYQQQLAEQEQLGEEYQEYEDEFQAQQQYLEQEQLAEQQQQQLADHIVPS